MRELTYREALREAIIEEMERDENVFLIGEDIGAYGGGFKVLEGLLEQFGAERVMDTPVSEAAFVGTAIGAAMTGMRPVVELMFSDFISVCFDQIINEAAKIHFMYGGQLQVPMVIRSAAGAGTGAAAQHSQSLESLLCHIPGLKVVVPSTAYDAKGLLKAAIRDNNPVIFQEQKLLYGEKGEVPEEEYIIPLGKADIKRAGADITLISYGRMVGECLRAADLLEREGYSAEVLDLRTLSPLDTESIIQSVKRTGRALIVHESVQFAGFGGEISAVIMESEAFSALKAPVQRFGGSYCPIPSGKVLESSIFPAAESIAARALPLLHL